MADFDTQTSNTLHHEHTTVAEFLKKFESQLLQYRVEEVPDAQDSALTALLGDLIAIVETELIPHFKFEEDALFPILQKADADDLCDLLQEEHDVILPIAKQLCEYARGARKGGHDADGWARFRRDGLALVENLSGHIDKEEMSLVPLLDETLDEEQDLELANNYMMMR
ncbi:MAG: hemerythrin domain-containing protein [Xanthomonadales bacterium]|nr:hemerythrin domain-containing protein [Xanthomonadales bacterium]